MLFGNVFATFGAAPSLALSLLSAVYFIASLCVYVSLIYQISVRIRSAFEADVPTGAFGLPEAVLASVLIFFFLLTISSTVPDPALQFHPRNLLANFLFFAYPLFGFSETINQRFFGGGSSKQSIVEFFSGSRTIEERVLIIVFAVAIAPIVEEFVFRFFIYGVLKRYVGCLLGVILSSLLFAAAHAHFPSFVPLFVLGSCFAIAYEWSDSILVSMTMHSLFNSLTLTALAFPEFISQ